MAEAKRILRHIFTTVCSEVRMIMDRVRMSLDSDWKFYLGEIAQEKNVSHGAIYNTAKAGACQGVPQSDYDVSGWEVVQIPHDWSVKQPFDEENAADWGYKSRGTAWYRKSFLLPEEYKEKKLVIGFEGVATHCTVYFNGSVVARNFCGYTPFTVDITDMALFGKVPNVLAVYVDAEEWEGWWYEGAGIYRHVWLEALNSVYIDRDSVFLQPKEVENSACTKWVVDAELDVCNETDKEEAVMVRIDMCTENGTDSAFTIEKEILAAPGKNKVFFSFEADHPLLWDVDSPNLYQVTVTAYLDGGKTDHVDTVCGFRTISIDREKGFFLNHRPLKLYGTCNHQDFGGLGIAVNDNLWEYHIERLKEMGTNAYRCAHGMTSEALIAACDRQGMLVMAENRNYDSSEEGLRQLEILVKRHRNHPSVMMYSIFNEEPLQGTRQGRRMAKRMCRLVHQLAPGSLTTGAMNGGVFTDENAAFEVDACGINYQKDVYDTFHQQNPQIPMIATETTSTFSVRGCYQTVPEKNEISCYDEDASDWGNNVRDTWKAIMERDFVAGGFMWTGFDYLGEPTPHIWPSVSSFFGMMDTCGFPKDGYYLSKAIFSKEPVCHVLPHWNHKGKEGQNIRVMSHTNCEEAELFVNGKSFGKKPVDIFTQVYWEVPYEPGTIRLAGYRNGKEVASDCKTTTKAPESLQLLPWQESIQGNGRDAMPVAIVAIDEEKREVPDADFMVTIEVKHGKLLGSCNGNPNCHEAFDGKNRSVFHGRCMAVVMPEQGAEQVEVEAKGVSENGTVCYGRVCIPVVACKQEYCIPTVSEHYLTEWNITSALYTERPDVFVKMEDYDMNSWEHIRVDYESGSPKKLENQQGKYVIYQTKAKVPATINGHIPTLFFHGIWGECEIYLNGKKRSECSYGWPEQHSIALEKEETGDLEIRILVRSTNINAGLNSLVVLR
ncbi:MAG: DUF4982 domain-containing protein [Butyribacter sp.]|nr:DUF4982 domain-containing protein [bacterium]MDY3853364.1 DUF4982 domain-containing protein [Butyribacter sp.]